ncbi:MAG: methanogenesis marker 6 protein [Candidatus Hadarchaeales archaeon]
MKKEGRILVISPGSELTPEALCRYLVERGVRARIKETCFGVVLEGEEEALREAVRSARELDRYGVFSKPRGYPPGDPRICRAHRGGSPRMGFHFLDYELEKLPLIGEALKDLEEGREAGLKREERRKLPVGELKRVLAEEVP